MSVVGAKLAVGIVDRLSVINLPPGKIRFRMRPAKPVKMFARHNGATSQFVLLEVDGGWKAVEVGRNIR